MVRRGGYYGQDEKSRQKGLQSSSPSFVEPKAIPGTLHFIFILIDFFIPVPSVAVAVIATIFPFPAFKAVTTPLLLTVAYFLLDEVHFSDLFAVFPPLTVAFIVCFAPAFMDVDAFNVIFVTPSFTILILIFADFLLPSLAVAVMVTVFPMPDFLVTTCPLLATVAYFVFEDFQATAGYASSGSTFATIDTFFPAQIVVEGLALRLIEETKGSTGIGGSAFLAGITTTLPSFIASQTSVASQ